MQPVHHRHGVFHSGWRVDFLLVFRGYGGDEMVQALFAQMPGGMRGALGIVMLVIFLLGFILDFIEITFVVVPIVGPVRWPWGLIRSGLAC